MNVSMELHFTSNSVTFKWLTSIDLNTKPRKIRNLLELSPRRVVEMTESSKYGYIKSKGSAIARTPFNLQCYLA